LGVANAHFGPARERLLEHGAAFVSALLTLGLRARGQGFQQFRTLQGQHLLAFGIGGVVILDEPGAGGFKFGFRHLDVE
jgi:hypothetical protein